MSLPWPRRSAPRVAVVGAGLAGLNCARLLSRLNMIVDVYDAEEVPGGRLRTRITPEGYRLDRGFQILFAGYPALLRAVRLGDLAPRFLPSGIRVMMDGGERLLSNPLFDVRGTVPTIGSGLVCPADIVPALRLIGGSASLGDAALTCTDMPAGEWLASRTGLSARLRDDVLGPLFAGISLDLDATSDATFLRFVLRYLSLGRTFLPALGIASLPQRLAAHLPPERMHLGAAVTAIQPGEGIEVEGRMQPADAVVVATELPAAVALAGVALDVGRRSCTTVYLASDRPCMPDARLLLRGQSGDRFVNHALQLTHVSEEYAPPGRHLLSATVPGEPHGSDQEIAARAVEDLRSWYGPATGIDFEFVAVVRVPFSQFAQPPGIYRRLPTAWTGTRGLYLAGEYLHSSSVQGALRGGELAAMSVAADYA